MFDDIDFSPGLIAYNGTEFLDQEDIFQVRYNYGMNIIIDVGWYRKEFAVVVIKDYDWDNPLMEKRCVDLNKLHDLVQECSEYVREIIA
ncbi:hypothetical protein SAMN05428961_11411 [Paenibacillus sp. OK060]|uniref:hypothetical protein n=1 Tax=Paenibacillus sp. OK060 TaxID=1881034 RepID=UPI00088D34BE|nr:hypothetical protein [Paenibacillus sp. OK060]SDM32775.1 hypothetical protein SAMN05428961_11411 [Paenibacillus sp. OK060]